MTAARSLDESGPVLLAGATVYLPKGWMATTNVESGPQSPLSWCLGPAQGCPIRFEQLDPDVGRTQDPTGRGGLNPEAPGGYRFQTNPITCPDGAAPQKRTTRAARASALGGRVAEYRDWVFACGTTTTESVQYLVPTGVPYLLYVPQATPALIEAAAAIAANSQLPTATSSMRLVDQGKVVSFSDHGSYADIVVQRTRGANQNDWLDSTERTAYRIPKSAVPLNMPLQQFEHDAIDLSTDGSVVTYASLPGF